MRAALGPVSAFCVGLMLLASACGGHLSKEVEAPPTPAGTTDATPARVPDAVYLEPPPALPDAVYASPGDATATATASAAEQARDPVVTLREPVDAVRVRATVALFFDALAREDDTALAVLLTSDALALDSHANRTPLLRQMRQRLRQHDFSRLAGLEVARPRDIVTYERAPEARMGRAGEGAAGAKASDPHDADVAVRVPMENPRPAGEPLFPDTIYLLVRDVHGALRISAEAEDAAP